MGIGYMWTYAKTQKCGRRFPQYPIAYIPAYTLRAILGGQFAIAETMGGCIFGRERKMVTTVHVAKIDLQIYHATH